MFKLDLEALQRAAATARLTANLANAANQPTSAADSGSQLATLAISHGSHSAANDPFAADAVAKLIAAAMRACDHWGDSPEAREQMRHDVLDTPLHLRADLLAHFTKTYPKAPP